MSRKEALLSTRKVQDPKGREEMVRIQISLSSRLPISRALREGSLERVLGIFIFNKANLGQREFTLPSVDVCSPVVTGVRAVGSSHCDGATHSRHTSSETVIIRAVRVEQYSAGRASRAPAAHWFVKEIGRSAVVEPGFDLECTRRAHNDSVTHYRCRGAKAVRKCGIAVAQLGGLGHVGPPADGLHPHIYERRRKVGEVGTVRSCD